MRLVEIRQPVPTPPMDFSQFIGLFAHALAIATGCILVVGSFYVFNALNRVWNSRNRSAAGILRLNPYPGGKESNARYDVHLSKGRVIRNLAPLGVVAPDPESSVPGLPPGLFAYTDTSGCWVLVNPGAVQAIAPSATSIETGKAAG